jgi:thymidylate synthase ThyX
MYEAKILLDSISETGKRLTTFQVTFSRIVLSEYNTHRMLSRNSASSRAIPFLKQLSYIVSDPFIPDQFPINGKGMQPLEYYSIDSVEHKLATGVWLSARDSMIEHAKKLTGNLPAGYESSGSDFRSDKEIFLNVHKQIANRLLEPFMYHTVICTASEWDNFFKLRTHSDAQREIKRIADMMYDLYHSNYNPVLSSPQNVQYLKEGEWHCPLVTKEDEKLIDDYIAENLGHESIIDSTNLEIKKKISAARCARVSYLTHDGVRDIFKDLELFARLTASGHWSPLEHVARPFFVKVPSVFGQDEHYQDLWSGNFLGWKAYRKEFKEENCTNFRK